MPVVRTARKNSPSKRASRASLARWHTSGSRGVCIGGIAWLNGMALNIAPELYPNQPESALYCLGCGAVARRCLAVEFSPRVSDADRLAHRRAKECAE